MPVAATRTVLQPIIDSRGEQKLMCPGFGRESVRIYFLRHMHVVFGGASARAASFVGLTILCLTQVFAQTRTYQPSQAITCPVSLGTTQCLQGDFDHKWPSLNNKGDIVWNQQVGGYWQVFLLSAGSTTAVAVTSGAQNHEKPVIADNGDIVYFVDNTGGGIGYEVIRCPAGISCTNVLEFSSSDGNGNQRVAGKNFEIAASNGNTISYYDLVQTVGVNTTTKRLFDVSGAGHLQCGGDCNFLNGTVQNDYYDYPGINKDNVIVYTDNFRVTPPNIYGLVGGIRG